MCKSNKLNQTQGQGLRIEIYPAVWNRRKASRWNLRIRNLKRHVARLQVAENFSGNVFTKFSPLILIRLS